MKLIFHYLRRHRLLFTINIFAVLGVAAAEIGIPLIISTLIDKGLIPGDNDVINLSIILLFSVAFAGGLGQLLLNYCAAKTSTTIVKEIRYDIYAKVQEFSPNEYDKFGISSLITRTTSDVFQIMQFINMFFRTALMAPTLIIISIILSIVRAPQLIWITLTTIPIIIIVIIIIAVKVGPLSEKQQQGLDSLNQISRENLTGVRVIRAFRKSDEEKNRFSKINQSYSNNTNKLFRILNFAEPIFFFILNISIVLIMFAGSQMLANANPSFSIGKLTEFIDYQFHILFSVMMVSLVFMMYPRTKVSARRINEIFNTTPTIVSNKDAIALTDNPNSIEFVNVDFKYHDSSTYVLKNISFKANKGEKVSFIGSTGSGKSSLIQLIPRFYDVTAGRILIDNINVSEYDVMSLRSRIGYIAQKALLFSGTIEDNIKYGKTNATTPEIISASRIAQAEDFILSKPKKFKDVISESGTNLSGGQKQRLSIARAVVRHPSIYIFDDSFSALDYKTDATLRKALEAQTKDSIVLVVAQRISSIIDSDQIIVLEEGKIVGTGTHHELLETCIIYQEIARSQFIIKEEI